MAKTTRTPVTFGALLAIFLLGMGLRLYGLDATSLWGDELYTATRAHPDLSSVIETMATKGDNPPLSFVIIGSLVNLLGSSDFAYRFASALLGSLSVLLTYKTGEILWTRKVGLIGSFLLAVSPFHIRYSQWARHYAITAFLVLLSLVLFLKALETGRKGLWLGFAVAATLSIYNQYFAFLALGALAIYGACVIAVSAVARAKSSDFANGTHASKHLPGPSQQALRFACSLGLVALLFAPWLPSMEGHIYGPIGWEGFGGATAIQVHQLSGYFGRWLTEYAGIDGPLAPGFLALFVLGLAHSKREHAFFTTVWVGVPLLFTLTVVSRAPAVPRYSIFVLPIYLLAVGRGGLCAASVLQRALNRFARKRGEAGLITTLLVVLAFAALSVAPLRTYYLGGQHEDWHVVSQYLAHNVLPGDIILADGVGYAGIRDSRRVVMALSHYLPIHGTMDTPILEVQRGLSRELTRVAQHDGRVWAAVWYPPALRSWQDTPYDSIVYFPWVLLIRPSEPSGDVLKDAASTLHVLLELMPSGEARFDVHLALADIYLRTWRLEDAESQLQEAAAVQPDRSGASTSLRKALLHLERISSIKREGRIWCDVGQVVALVGYDISPAGMAPNNSVDLTLWWEAIGDMNVDYTAFVHLVDQQGRILAQEDRLLRHGELLTSGWVVGDIVKEEYRLEFGPDTAPGGYVTKAGVYYWETGERLPVRDEQGHRLPEDTIVLKTIGEVH